MARTRASPRPEEQPVTNQTSCLVIFGMYCKWRCFDVDVDVVAVAVQADMLAKLEQLEKCK
ncbi:hypothetical protein N7490_003677 [Penicillium lividum]|nr:hypothetical protein N7490_003677 [Penicillium lividum]